MGYFLIKDTIHVKILIGKRSWKKAKEVVCGLWWIPLLVTLDKHTIFIQHLLNLVSDIWCTVTLRHKEEEGEEEEEEEGKETTRGHPVMPSR